MITETKTETENTMPVYDSNATPEVIQKEAKSLVEMQKRAGFLKRMFPDEAYREFARAQLEHIKTELEFQTKALIIAKNGQIEYMRNQVDAMVSVNGIAVKAWQEKEIRKLVCIREKEVNEFTANFIEEYNIIKSKVDALPEGKLKDLETQRVERVLEDTFKHLNYFKDQFDKSLKFAS